jgi:hypothetical protein
MATATIPTDLGPGDILETTSCDMMLWTALALWCTSSPRKEFIGGASPVNRACDHTNRGQETEIRRATLQHAGARVVRVARRQSPRWHHGARQVIARSTPTIEKGCRPTNRGFLQNLATYQRQQPEHL